MMSILNGRLTTEGFEAPLLHRLLLPRVSGNEINGLGESQIRRPRKIYHWCYTTRRIRYPHYWVNLLLLFRARLSRRFWPIASECLYEQHRGNTIPIATRRVERDAAEWKLLAEQKARESGADLVGFVETDPAWIVEGCDSPGRHLIVLGIRMDYQGMEFEGKHNDSVKNGVAIETMRGYLRGQRVVNSLLGWLSGEGWPAEGGCGPQTGPVTLIPAALAAGFGELGKHGSIVNREFGSALRLAYVATDIPLVVDDQPDKFGVDAFCANCQVCTKACPAKAISSEKQLVRGAVKWYVDFDKCMPYFNEEFGCGICITKCPWTLPGVAPRLVRKMERRRSSEATPLGEDR